MEQETCYSKHIEFEASLSMETQRIPDPWSYYVAGEKLISPITMRPVEEAISRRSVRDLADLRAFQKIQRWGVYGNEPAMVWVSPPADSDLSAKAVISEIVYDDELKRRIFNRALCFDWNPSIFLDFARRVNAGEISTPEDFRKYPFTLNVEQYEEIVNLMRELEPRQVEMMESGEDIKIKRRIMAKMASGQAVPMGRYSPSCGSPTAAFNLVYENAFKEHFNCPRCDGKIPSGRGITTCPYCGAKKEDYGSACD